MPLKWTWAVLLPCSQASSDFCSSVCVQYNTQKRKSGIKTKRPGNTYHVSTSKMDVEWEGPIFKYVWMISSALFLRLGHSPPTSTLCLPNIMHRMNEHSLFPIFRCYSVFMYILNANQRKKWGRPGNCFCKLISPFTSYMLLWQSM